MTLKSPNQQEEDGSDAKTMTRRKWIRDLLALIATLPLLTLEKTTPIAESESPQVIPPKTVPEIKKAPASKEDVLKTLYAHPEQLFAVPVSPHSHWGQFAQEAVALLKEEASHTWAKACKNRIRNDVKHGTFKKIPSPDGPVIYKWGSSYIKRDDFSLVKLEDLKTLSKLRALSQKYGIKKPQ